MERSWIKVRGAREHNLKGVDVDVPRDALCVITGVSGSGKSSLAFDTIYAEGQRRYVESLSAYARQFLERLDKPDVESIEGLSPAISIQQRTVAASNPRSIVATTTEIYDYLRLLFAHLGQRHCPRCGARLERQSPDAVVERILGYAEERLLILAPLALDKASAAEWIGSMRARGIVRVRIDGESFDLDAPPHSLKEVKRLEAVVDRVVALDAYRARIADSVETAFEIGEGRLVVNRLSDGSDTAFSEELLCDSCGVFYRELTSRSFSFNSPDGACPRCLGLGRERVVAADRVVPDPELSALKGAIEPWRRGGRRAVAHYRRLLKALGRELGVDMNVPYRELPAPVRRIILEGFPEERKLTVTTRRMGRSLESHCRFEGVLANIGRRIRETTSESVRQALERCTELRRCSECGGRRLKPETLACTVRGRSIGDILDMTVGEAGAFMAELALDGRELAMVGEVCAEIQGRLGLLEQVGVAYLGLGRVSGSLSGGEAQRLRLATQIGCGLVGVLYVLDEPTVGLHPRDTEKLIAILKRLRDAGNSVLVVEHDELTLRAADYIVDMGPGAGREGGTVVASGALAEVLACRHSETGNFLAGRRRIEIPATRATPSGWLTLRDVATHNLKTVSVNFPLGVLCGVSGVSGSGKSSLVTHTLRPALERHFDGKALDGLALKSMSGQDALSALVVVDQEPIGRSPRSNPATYTGLFDDIRQLFAKTPAARVRGYAPGRFSFNVKGGRCETCKGEGQSRLEMHFLPDVYVPCAKCGGLRFNHETLTIRFKGLNIAEILNLTVDEALVVFDSVPSIKRRLSALSRVGIGYVQLGQSAMTLSGGEAQRVKLARDLARVEHRRSIYVLDEPTTGLHFSDTERLLDVLYELRDRGHSLIVIEHNLEVLKCCDYLIDLGPEGGADGGDVVAAGTPESVARHEGSHTGRHLRKALATVDTGKNRIREDAL